MMRFDRAAAPFVLGALVAAGLSYSFVHAALGAVCLILGVGLLLFFRDPERTIAAVAGTVASRRLLTNLVQQSRVIARRNVRNHSALVEII